MRRPARPAAAMLATFLGTGYSPIAPGTVGSVLTTALYVLASALGAGRGLLAVVAVPLLVLGWLGCRAGYRMWGEDPPRVTVDEAAGCWLACLAAPPHWGLPGVGAALALFRLLDILKPWPVGALDRLSGPWGILLDDVAAGLLSGALLQLVALALR